MGGPGEAPHLDMTWWEVLIQQTINGLTRGAIFALIALGYTMVYGIIELINFAHGDVFMLGLFISLAWFTLLGVTGALTGWQLVTVLPLVFLLTMMTTAALNVAIDRVAYRPLRRSSRLAPLITAIGVSFMLENIALLWKGPAPIAYPDVFPSVDILREWFGIDSNIFFTTKDVLVIAATIPLMIGADLLRARAPDGARPCGPPPRTARPLRPWASTWSARSSSPSWWAARWPARPG